MRRLMEWIIGIMAVLGIWAFLSVLGSERERRVRDLERQIATVTAEGAKAAGQAAPAGR